MATIAFVTCAQYPELTADDQVAAGVLRGLGVTVLPAIWRDTTIDWSYFDLIVLRSMWDYHLHPTEFQEWLEHIQPFRVLNPISVARWNMDKHYLRDLQQSGVNVVPTEWYNRNAAPDIAEVMDRRGWQEIVVKPTVSSTAFRTWRIRREEADAQQDAVHALLRERAAMLQEYQPAILSFGEWSLTFIDGELTHTVVKTAAPGDFRVQEEYGGQTEAREPPVHVLTAARTAMQFIQADLLYGRVDGVDTPDGFRLMEFELLEPGLFFLNAPAAAERFAQAILRRL